MGGSTDLSLGQWLDERRHSEGLSLRQTAAKAGLSHVTIADIINGNRPSAETVKKLADAFADDTQQRLALEDQLLALVGYRSPRPEADVSEPLARLIDKLSNFSDPQLGIMEHFADFLSRTERR